MKVKLRMRRIFLIAMAIFAMILPIGAQQTFAFTSANTNASGLSYHDGYIYVANFVDSKISKISDDGTITDVINFNNGEPYSLDFDSEGNFYYTFAYIGYPIDKIYKISSTDFSEGIGNPAEISTEVITGGVFLYGLAFHPITGDFYFGDYVLKKLYTISKKDFNDFPIPVTSQKVHEIGTMPYSVSDIAFDSIGNLYFSYSSWITKVTADDLADGHIDNPIHNYVITAEN